MIRVVKPIKVKSRLKAAAVGTGMAVLTFLGAALGAAVV
jgi:hypothetical protein